MRGERLAEASQLILGLGCDDTLAAERQRKRAHVGVAAGELNDLLVHADEAIEGCGRPLDFPSGSAAARRSEAAHGRAKALAFLDERASRFGVASLCRCKFARG